MALEHLAKLLLACALHLWGEKKTPGVFHGLILMFPVKKKKIKEELQL
jgi:hypothetical protein